jgi:hypothetical protein
MFELETITDGREQRTVAIKHKAVCGRFSVAECLAFGAWKFVVYDMNFRVWSLESGDGGRTRKFRALEL